MRLYAGLQAGGRRFDQLTDQQTRIPPPTPPGVERLQYNWVTPIILSPHNPQIVYTGAQFLFRA